VTNIICQDSPSEKPQRSLACTGGRTQVHKIDAIFEILRVLGVLEVKRQSSSEVQILKGSQRVIFGIEEPEAAESHI
jgi:hypothetical protein